ncbi:MAG: GtrA family protein, partial [Bacilli bacterium]
FKNHSKNTKIQVIKFLLVKLISFFIDSFVLIVCHKFLYLDDFWSKLISNASTTISNYVFNKNIVFKDK